MNRALTSTSRVFASINKGVGRRAIDYPSYLCPLSASGSSSLFFNSRGFATSSEHEQQQQNGFFSSSNVGRILAIGGIVLIGGVAVNEMLEKRSRVLAAEQIQRLSEAILKDLRSALDPSRVDISEGIRQQHGKDFSYHEPHLPDVVVFPLSEQEVQKIVNISSKYNLPLVPYAGGTSLEGHTSALNGGICINFSKMAKVLKLNKEDMDVTVQPGISYDELNEQLKGTGLFFPMDPGPGACIGGMVGTSCSGTHAVRYGTMKDNVLRLRVVLPNGKVVKTGNRAKKSSAGYDLTHLFIGSEGTLGIATEITLKLKRRPEKLAVAVCNFPSARDAASAVIQTMQAGVQIGRSELLDEVMIKAVNIHSDMKLPVAPTLFFEFSGTPKQVDEQISIVQKIAEKTKGTGFRFAVDETERESLWTARKVALWASPVLKPGADIWITDVCVPISRLADCIEQTKVDLAKSPLPAPMVAHAGDGNFHLFILFDSKNPQEYLEAKKINTRLVQRAIAMEGTCTGEHGVGFGKRDYLVEELGAEAIDLMRTLKGALDPKGLFNPGKILPPTNQPSKAL